MYFRISLALGFFIIVLNATRLIPALAGNNVFEKLMFLIAAFICIFARKPDKVVIACLSIIIVMVLVLAMATEYSGFRWAILISAMNQFFVPMVLLSCNPNRKDAELLLPVVAWLPIMSAVLGMAYSTIGISPQFAREFSTGVFRYTASLNTPAFLSGLAMCGIFASLNLVLEKRRAFIYLCVADLLVLLMAGGRAALACTIIACAGLIFFKRGVPTSTKLMASSAGVLLGGFMALFLWERIFTRFSSSGDNGRDLMWSYIYTLIDRYPWTGIGFGHQFFSVPREIVVITSSAAAHNDFLRLTVELGYAGAIIFYVLLCTAVLRTATRQPGATNVVLLVNFLAFLLLSRTDNAMASPFYFPLVFLAQLTQASYLSRNERPQKSSKPLLPGDYRKMRARAAREADGSVIQPQGGRVQVE